MSATELTLSNEETTKCAGRPLDVDRLDVPLDEVAPCAATALWPGIEAVLPEHLRHGGTGDVEAEFLQFADDSSATPLAMRRIMPLAEEIGNPLSQSQIRCAEAGATTGRIAHCQADPKGDLRHVRTRH